MSVSFFTWIRQVFILVENNFLPGHITGKCTVVKPFSSTSQLFADFSSFISVFSSGPNILNITGRNISP